MLKALEAELIWLIATKDTGPSVLQPKGTEFCQQPGLAWKHIFSQSFCRSAEAGHHFGFGFNFQEQRN